MRRFLRHNGLSLVLLLLFLVFWAGQAWTGYCADARERTTHGQESLTFGDYLGSGHFWEATAENWESEFLQMGAYVFLTSFLLQRGSAESEDPDRHNVADESVAAHAHDPGAPAILRRGALVRWLYQYSLSIAFLLLFLVSFGLHARGGYVEHCAEALRDGEAAGSFGEFITGAKFWFQSLQNWQSEFLAVLSIVILSIWLRHHGSPESKHVWASHSSTGK